MSTLCITWWSSWLWKSIVEAFVHAWWDVIVLARSKEKLEALQQTLWADKVSFFVTDIRDKESLKKAFTGISTIDCLINNSGIANWDEAATDTLDQIKNTIATNLIWAMWTTNLALPIMIQQKAWVIINISSIAAKETFTTASSYCASKAWLTMYGDVVREEVRKHWIKVINIHPWATDTSIRTQQERSEYGNQMMDAGIIATIIVQACLNAMKWIVQEEITIRPPTGNIDFWE